MAVMLDPLNEEEVRTEIGWWESELVLTRDLTERATIRRNIAELEASLRRSDDAFLSGTIHPFPKGCATSEGPKP